MTSEYGFDPLPRNPAKILEGHKKDSPYIPISEIALPDSDIVRAVEEYAKNELSPETYNHSVRAFYYGAKRKYCDILTY